MYRPNEQDNGISLSRVVFAIVLSIVFFAAYAYFFPQKQHNTNAQNAQVSPSSSSVVADSTSQVVSTPQSTQTQTEQVSTTPKSLKNTIISRIDSKDFEIEIDGLGRIKQVYLKDEKYTRNDQTSLFAMIGEALGFKVAPIAKYDKLPLFDNSQLHALEVRFSDSTLNQKAFETPYIANISHIDIVDSPITLTLTQNLDTLTITKNITLYPDLHYEVNIELSNPNVEYFISNGMRPTADHDTYAFRGVITRSAVDSVLHKFEDSDASGDYIAKKATDIRASSFVASVDRYYTSLFFTKDPKGFFVVLSGDNAQNPMPYVRFEGNSNFLGYIGPKVYYKLLGIDENLGDVVEYGRITFFAKPLFLLLEYLYRWCGNWGWAIVLLTLLVRVVLYPLTYKGMVSMQKLKDIAPKMKEIQTRYKDDPQKLQMHMMDLYKKHGANPLGGCLPLLLQIPVFFAIYRVLHNAVELKSSEWIVWIDDLSAIDPYFVLPILMGLSMYVSQRITPSNFTDPMQEKIFKMLPLIFAIFFIVFPFPAGLVLYWTTNNIISIIQQVSINKILERRKSQEIESHKHQQSEDKK